MNAVKNGQIILSEWKMADHQMLLLNTSQTEKEREMYVDTVKFKNFVAKTFT